MKDTFGGSGCFAHTRKLINCQFCLFVLLLLGVISALPAWGQAPGLAWTNNAGAALFAVDAQGNIYASTNGTVEVLNSSGQLIQTTNICPIPGIAQRDASGNYYFAGSFAGTQDFGGITLVGGFIFQNNPPDPHFPTCYLAKYNSGGSLIWVVPFGHYSFVNRVDDMAVNADGSVTIGYDYSGNPVLTQFSVLGTNLWQTTNLRLNSLLIGGALKVSGNTGVHGCFLLYETDKTLLGGFYDSTGQLATFTQVSYPFPGWTNSLSWNAKPVPGTNNDVYLAMLDITPPNTFVPVLQDDQSGQVVLSSQPIAPVEQWAVAGDGAGKVYLAGADGSFSEYLGNGTLIWTTNYGPPVSAMMLDSQGNRYISRLDGSIARLQADVVAGPAITNAPQGGTIFSGANFTFNVGASGYAPLGYQWLYQSNILAASSLISGATNATLTLSNTSPAQSGYYSVIISNVANSITSAPVTLQVKSVEFYSGSQMLTNGSYSFSSPPTLTIQSAFPNGETFYTLDGSTPNFLSAPYTGAFVLSNSATINAIGYSADFSQSGLADTVIATVPPQYTLSASTPGGGSISLSPPGGSYTNTTLLYGSNTTVTATAIPAAGYSFLYWQGAATGTSPNISVTMNHNQTLSAVFGTTLSTTVSGNGRVMLAPPGGTYAYGAVVRLEALPAPGNFFGVWGNAGTWGGTTNPLYFPVTNPTPTVSSVFAAVPANQAALTVLILGKGKVSASLSGNLFATNQSVTLTATPDAGQSFIDWSGSVSSTLNPLTVAMTQSRVMVASFTGQSVSLRPMIPPPGLSPAGFKFMVMGDPQSVYQIQCLTNITHTNWQNLGLVTNSTGQTQFTDAAATNAPSTFYRALLVQP